MKSLRKKFVKNIVIIFLIVLIVMFFVVMLQMQSFFSNTVLELDAMENQFLAEDVNTSIQKYQGATESLAQNANLADMLAVCVTPDAFNKDHNFDLVSESMSRAQATLQSSPSPLWAYSVAHQYLIRTGERAQTVPMNVTELARIAALQENMLASLTVEYITENGESILNIVTPVMRNGELCGLVGTSLDVPALLRSVGEKAGLNNMVTDCTLIVPYYKANFEAGGYHEFSMRNGELVRTDLPADFLSAYPDGLRAGTDEALNQNGMKYLSEIGGRGWYLSSFVPHSTVVSAFFSGFFSFGMLIYALIAFAVLAIVWYISYKLTQPIHDLGALVANLRSGDDYARLKGNNEITQAADSLIEFARDNTSLLREIGVLAQKIERGALFNRFEDAQDESARHEIKRSLNQMLDSITQILDTLPVGIAIVDEDHTLIYLNRAIRQLLGVRAEDVRDGFRVEDLERVNERGRNIIVREIDRCKQKNCGGDASIYVMERHISFATAAFEYTQCDNKKAAFLQVYLDQTELIEKIQEQEQIFAYFEHLSLVKKEALDRLSKGDFAHASIEIGARPSVPYLQAIYDNQLETKQAFSDTVRNIESIITKLDEATKAFAGGNLHTVIDANHAMGKYAELVKTANNAFDVILNYFQTIPVPIRIIGADYQVKFFNQAAYASGFRPGADVRCYHLYGSDRPCETCPRLTEIKDVSIREYSFEENGKWHYWKSYRNPLLDEDGEIANMLEIRIDETEVVELKKAADSANMAKSTFIANMSHEIRTPMNAILGYSQLLELSKTLNGSEMDYVKTIRRSGAHLLGLINDILEMSKIEAGKITMVEQPFDLHALLQDVHSMFLPQMDAKGLSFRIQMADDAVNVLGDVGKTRQILFNVISNAVKFTDTGSITLSAVLEKTDDRIVATIDVRDTGAGIARPEWERVFAAFEQAEAGNQSGVGTGLGMAISRNFARLMGGDLSILESEPGVGTTFRICLHFDKDNTAPSAATHRDGTVCGIDRACTVLISDDAADNREILEKLLSRIGFSVISTEDNDALDLWKTQGPDVVITDPSANKKSYALVCEIRAQEKNMHTPVIVLTANALETEKRTALDAGADAFLTKPFALDILLREIKRLTGVGYLFDAEETVSDAPPESAAAESLPDAVREQLRGAVLRGDFDTAAQIAESAAGECPVTAARIQSYADDFDKESILDILDRHK